MRPSTRSTEISATPASRGVRVVNEGAPERAAGRTLCSPVGHCATRSTTARPRGVFFKSTSLSSTGSRPRFVRKSHQKRLGDEFLACSQCRAAATYRTPLSRIYQPAILVCDIIRSQLDAQHQNRIFLTTSCNVSDPCTESHGSPTRRLVPGDDLSGGIQAGPQIMRRDRTQATLCMSSSRVHIICRAFCGLREKYRVHNVIIVAVTASAEASAEQGIVQGNFFAGDAECLSGGGRRPSWDFVFRTIVPRRRRAARHERRRSAAPFVRDKR